MQNVETHLKRNADFKRDSFHLNKTTVGDVNDFDVVGDVLRNQANLFNDFSPPTSAFILNFSTLRKKNILKLDVFLIRETEIKHFLEKGFGIIYKKTSLEWLPFHLSFFTQPYLKP